jgi:predicted TPR repeat methyltransferase
MAREVQERGAGRSETADPQALFAEAVQLHQQKHHDEAEGRYIQLLQLLPDHPRVLANLALLYRELRRFEEAVRCCRQALRETPDDPMLHLNLGAVYEEQGDIPAAVASLRRALDLEPDNPRVLNNLGKVLHRQGEAAEAEKCLRRALHLAPEYPLALNNLGVILSEAGNIGDAADCFSRALRLEPDNVGTLYNLAGIHNCRGEVDHAVPLLEKILALEPGHSLAGHMLAALAGETTETAPRAYVEATFDAYAGRFDRHLTEKLGYTVPKVLREMVGELIPQGQVFSSTLDLGCGTGLAGEAFRTLSRRLEGIDVSANMLARAAEKGVYDLLKREEAETFLAGCHGTYDLVVATDVFVYIGRLEPIFAGLARCAAPGAMLAFSVERCAGEEEYCLRPSGRYAQSRSYIDRLAGEYGWEVLGHRQHGIRREEGQWIDGDLFVLRLCAGEA